MGIYCNEQLCAYIASIKLNFIELTSVERDSNFQQKFLYKTFLMLYKAIQGWCEPGIQTGNENDS